MAHFAKLGIGNKVETIIVVSNDIAVTEQAGIDFIKKLYPNDTSMWKQTSYNTKGGVHKLGGTPFRKNYAEIGGKYDESRDAFIDIQPFDSWRLNEDTCTWEPPTPRPDDQTKSWFWNENTQSWDGVDI
tara:strand:- start:250 stop:636 length:387 start_codon:yes stop_codon:yes gene_type:complete